MDDLFVGYLLDALDPPERQAVENKLREDAGARQTLDRLRLALAPLALDRDHDGPPTGLAARTLARIAAHVPAAPPRRPRVDVTLADRAAGYPTTRWRRIDALVAACVLIVLGGLGVSGVARVQRLHEQAACRNNLRQVYVALVSYADDRDGRFPRISDRPPNNVAAMYVPMLTGAGVLPDESVAVCPIQAVQAVDAAGPRPAAIVPNAVYSYTLGYRDADGHVNGLRLNPGDAEAGLLPIVADLPAAMSHRLGQNVLYVGGHVRFSTTSRVGVAGDEIYENQAARVAAGLHRLDSVLGPGDTCP